MKEVFKSVTSLEKDNFERVDQKEQQLQGASQLSTDETAWRDLRKPWAGGGLHGQAQLFCIQPDCAILLREVQERFTTSCASSLLPLCQAGQSHVICALPWLPFVYV